MPDLTDPHPAREALIAEATALLTHSTGGQRTFAFFESIIAYLNRAPAPAATGEDMPVINRPANGGAIPWTDRQQVSLATCAMKDASLSADTLDVYQAINQLAIDRDAARREVEAGKLAFQKAEQLVDQLRAQRDSYQSRLLRDGEDHAKAMAQFADVLAAEKSARLAAEKQRDDLAAALRKIADESAAEAECAADKYHRTGTDYAEGMLDAMCDAESRIKKVRAALSQPAGGAGEVR